MPWQWGQLDLTEGNRVIKYADEILDGASPNDGKQAPFFSLNRHVTPTWAGYTIYKNQTELWNIFKYAFPKLWRKRQFK